MNALFGRSLTALPSAPELGPEHPGTATGLNNLAFLYQAIGRYDIANFARKEKGLEGGTVSTRQR